MGLLSIEAAIRSAFSWTLVRLFGGQARVDIPDWRARPYRILYRRACCHRPCQQADQSRYRHHRHRLGVSSAHPALMRKNTGQWEPYRMTGRVAFSDDPRSLMKLPTERVVAALGEIVAEKRVGGEWR